MLKEFRFENFKSIKKEQVFTMEACPASVVSEFPEHIIEIGGERLLKVSSMYGPNGGGKSNLLKALNVFAMVTMGKSLPNDSIKNENYFPNVFEKNKNTKFTMFFVTNKHEVGYSIEVDFNKIGQTINMGLANETLYFVNYSIVKEEMVARELGKSDFIDVFTRSGDGSVSSKSIGDIDLISGNKKLSPNTTFVKYYCSTFSQSPEPNNGNRIFDLFKEFASYVVLTRESGIFRYLQKDVDELKPHLKRAVKILNSLDLRISELLFKEVDAGISSLYVRRSTKEGEYTELPIQNESKGTIKAINIVLGVLVQNDKQVFIADDFDSFLHPKLIRAIIELFNSNDIKKQLIINSHDITNMNNKVFRRDEIWFAYRDEDYSTKYIPLSSIVDYKGNMVRKDAVYGKQYLEGRYGADPFIQKGLNWKNA